MASFSIFSSNYSKIRAAEEAAAKKAEEEGEERERELGKLADRDLLPGGEKDPLLSAVNHALSEGYYNDEGVGGEDAYYNQGNSGQGMGRGRMTG